MLFSIIILFLIILGHENSLALPYVTHTNLCVCKSCVQCFMQFRHALHCTGAHIHIDIMNDYHDPWAMHCMLYRSKHGKWIVDMVDWKWCCVHSDVLCSTNCRYTEMRSDHRLSFCVQNLFEVII